MTNLIKSYMEHEPNNFTAVQGTTMESIFLKPESLNQLVEAYRKAITGRIKFIMRKRHIGQEKLAEMSGIPQSHISRIVTGKLNVTIDNLIRLLYCLDCSMHFEDDPTKSIRVFWESELAFQKRLKDFDDWKIERYKKRKDMEKYKLRLINSHPTLVQEDFENEFIKQVV